MRVSRREAWLVAAIIAFAFAAWLPGIRGGYHFDDAITPVSDPASASLGAWLVHVPDTLRPITKLTYALEAACGLDDDPPARRAASIAILAIGAVVLFRLLVALVPALSVTAAAALAAMWAAHPVHAEAVLAISGRTAALSGTLVLAALYAHARDRPRVAAALYALAGLARETAIAAIIAIVAVELATKRRPWREHASRLVPAMMAMVAVAVWLVATARVRELADYSFNGRPIADSALHQLAAVPVGLSLYVRTWALSIDHGTPLPPLLSVVGVALYALAVAGAIVAVARHRPAPAVGLALWLAALLPTQSFVPKLDALAERPLSLALAGVVIAVAPLVRRRAAIIAVAAIAIPLAIATVARGSLYRSDLALWRDAAGKSETNARPHMNYALFLHLDGRDRDALDELDRAHAIDPFDPNIARKRDALAAELGGADAR